MATNADFMEYVREQIGAAGEVAFRKMFGEYAVYLGGKVVALLCDNQFYLKPTAAGRALPWNEPVQARLAPGRGVEIAAGDATQPVGHLQGWEATKGPRRRRSRARRGPRCGSGSRGSCAAGASSA